MPLGLYLWTAAPAPTWLDSGEFLAVGVTLGAAHPPGHPIFVTLLKLLSLIPLGPIAFRGTLASALPAALTCFLAYHLNLLLARKLDTGAPRWLPPIFALLGALLLGTTPALWGQAVRLEVYALQLALVLVAVLAAAAYGLDARGERRAPLLAASSLAFGLSLANHHFLSLLLLPGLIVFLTEDALGGWKRTLRAFSFGGIPAMAVGLLAYLHLPLRTPNLSGAVSLGATPDSQTFFWVVSARAFQRAVTEPPTTAYEERLTEAVFLIMSQVGPIVAVVALGGLYFLIRQRWGLGALLLLGFAATWLARSWMGFDARNPDILGYFLVPVCVITVGATRLGPLLASVIPAKQTVRVGAATFAALLLITTIGFAALSGFERNNLSSYRNAEIVVTEQLAQIPPRTVLITELFGSGFNIWAAQTVEGARPDVSHFHFPFIGFPSYVQQVYATHPHLQGVLRTALTRGELDERELSALAQRRPVFIEPLLQTPSGIQPFLLPRGLTWEAVAEPLGITDLRMATPDHFARWDELLAHLGDGAREEQTMRVLLWRLYVDALLFAQRGERDASGEAILRALQLMPDIPELIELQRALGEGTGQLDVTPFLPDSAIEPGEHQHGEEPRPRVIDF